MTNDLLKNFEQYFSNSNVVIDSYTLEKGLYLLFDIEGNLKSELLIENEKKDATQSDIYDYFKRRDFYSKYLSSNKAIDTIVKEEIDGTNYSMDRKICSNNQYTLFFKNKFVKEISDDKSAIPIHLFFKGIDKYYESLSTMGEDKKEEKMILDSIRNDISTKEEILLYRDLMKKCYQNAINHINNGDSKLPKDIWIKIFIEASSEEYEKASNKYIALKIFNKNSNNVKTEKTTYGINNYNFGMNKNKEFIELKTTSYKIPSLVTIQDIKAIRNLFIWILKNTTGRGNVLLPIDFEFKGNTEQDEICSKPVYLMKSSNDNGAASVEYFEYIPNFTNRIKEFKYYNYVNSETNLKGLNTSVNKLQDFETFIRKTWFPGVFIKLNDINEENIKLSKLSGWRVELLRDYNRVFFELFNKEDESMFLQHLDDMALKVVKSQLKEELTEKHTYQTANAFNLWICLDEYFKRKEMSLKMKLEEIKTKSREIIIEQKEIDSIDDKLYFYIAGQVTRYLLSQSEANKLTQDLFEPIIESNNNNKLKNELYYLRQKYDYKLYLNAKRFNNVFSMLMIEEPMTSIREKENKFALLAGILADNLFFKSDKENKEEIED
ncbi:MAG: hypothetical protein Q4D02_01605 [Clostridia bacterium]|nr:hypothetical protein [Clostridia bacterium]